MTRVTFNLASSPYDEVVSARPRPRAKRRHSTTTTTAPGAVLSFVFLMPSHVSVTQQFPKECTFTVDHDSVVQRSPFNPVVAKAPTIVPPPLRL